GFNTQIFLLVVLMISDGCKLPTDGLPLFGRCCPEGWTLFGTRCFKFFDSKLTWTEAEKSCQTHGANLASIHSAEENAFVVDLIKNATGENRWTWIGGQDAETLWMWSDGSVWDYSKWPSVQPDNDGGIEHVLEINWAGKGSQKSVQNKNRTKSYTHDNVFCPRVDHL
uniref:C-type lectin domain-containing protein n=1 Tax=Neogobius melanostomus TaxID=47308 RepID=A0A8C6TC13_9GOBI